MQLRVPNSSLYNVDSYNSTLRFTPLVRTDLLQYQDLVGLPSVGQLMGHQQNQPVAKETLDAAAERGREGRGGEGKGEEKRRKTKFSEERPIF